MIVKTTIKFNIIKCNIKLSFKVSIKNLVIASPFSNGDLIKKLSIIKLFHPSPFSNGDLTMELYFKLGSNFSNSLKISELASVLPLFVILLVPLFNFSVISVNCVLSKCILYIFKYSATNKKRKKLMKVNKFMFDFNILFNLNFKLFPSKPDLTI